jgi:di/tricarboxylate transporter
VAGALSDATITYLVLAAAVAAFASGVVPTAVTAIGVALALWATGVLELEQTLAGFGDPAVIFIATLFVVSEALDATGVTAWAGQRLIASAGESRTRLIVLTMLLVAVVTALINVNGAVAALVPVVVVMAVRVGRSPSELLLPLAFGAHAGSMLALTGTPVNVIVSDAAGGFGFFEFALVGVPLVLGTITIVALFGERLLPSRTARTISPDYSGHARTLARQYALEHDELVTRRKGVAEVVIRPRSDLIGTTMFPGMVTDSGDLVVLAVQRAGETLGPGDIELAEGDVLLLRGTWAALDEQLEDPDVLVVDPPALVRRQAVPLGEGAKRALAILAAMVVLLATGAVPAAVAGLLAASAVVVLGLLTTEQAYRSVSWTTVLLVGGMMSLSVAMVSSGAAETLAEQLVDVVADSGGYALLAALFVLTAALGQVISNMATALIVIPIATTAAADMGLSAKPVLMAVTVSAAAAFLTPVATPANLMVQGPGGYRFGDYWKLGLPLLLLFGLVAVFLVPVFWSF